jgi:diguanylate cyclase (GGDEF)-like protein
VLTATVNRPGDLAARYGGEEFAVLLPETTLEGALHMAELIRQHIHQRQIPHRSSSTCAFVTASIGISTCIPTTDLQMQHLIQAADEALYESKRQ